MKKNKMKWLCMALAAANIMMIGNPAAMHVHAAELEVETISGIAAVSAEGEASITIRGNADQSMIGKEFSVHQLMTAEISVDGKSIDYTINEKYAESLKKVVAEKKGKEAAQVTEYEVIDYMQSLNVNKVDYADDEIVLEGRYSDYRYFIETVMRQIVADGLSGDVVVDVKNTRSDNTVVVSGLEYGYYLVQDTSASEGNHTAVSMLMVNTANPDFQVNIKADYPVVTKKIQEDDSQEWSDIADFEIGQDVPFYYESNIPNINGYSKYYYAWHDRMDEALTLQEDSIVITISGNLNGETKTYTLNAAEYDLLTDVEDESFVIEVADIKQIVDREFPAKDANGENVYGQIVKVSYTASLNDVAALDTGRPGFENDVRLEFSNNPWVNFEDETGFTPWDTVVCFTYTLDGVKVNNYGTELEGAKFRLYTDEECTNEVYVKKIEERYHVINEDSCYGTPSNAVEIISAADGTFSVYGLDSGTYYLKETEAPAGYRPILDPIKLVVTADFPEDMNSYVKGEGAEDSVLNLSAVAKTKVYVGGEYKEKELVLDVNQERGSMNLSVVNDIGKKLPITGSFAVPVLMGIGVTMVLVSFKKNQKEHE